MNTPKRFIAGARCPQCQQVDKIRCWHEDKLYKSECVRCGFSETLNEAGEKIDTVQVVRFASPEETGKDG